MEEFYYKVLYLEFSAAQTDRCLRSWAEFFIAPPPPFCSGIQGQALRFNVAVSCGEICFLQDSGLF